MSFEFPACRKRRVEADFSGGDITSNLEGGAQDLYAKLYCARGEPWVMRYPTRVSEIDQPSSQRLSPPAMRVALYSTINTGITVSTGSCPKLQKQT